MRKLETRDMFELARTVKKIGIKEELKNIAKEINEKGKELDTYEAGFDLVLSVIEKFSEKNSEQAFYEFLSGPFEVDPKEVETMEIIDLIEGIFEMASIDKWKSFLKIAVR